MGSCGPRRAARPARRAAIGVRSVGRAGAPAVASRLLIASLRSSVFSTPRSRASRCLRGSTCLTCFPPAFEQHANRSCSCDCVPISHCAACPEIASHAAMRNRRQFLHILHFARCDAVARMACSDWHRPTVFAGTSTWVRKSLKRKILWRWRYPVDADLWCYGAVFLRCYSEA